MELRGDLSNDKIVCWLSDQGEGFHMPTDFWHSYVFSSQWGYQRNYSCDVAFCSCGLQSFAAGGTCQGTCPRDMPHCHGHRGHLPSPGKDSSLVQPHPIFGVVHLPRASSHLIKLFTASLSQTSAGLAFLANAGSKTEICNFILPPPLPPLTCEPAGWLHQLWPAGWRSQSLLSSCVFRENRLRTQNQLTALGCCQTSVLNRGWRIHTGAQPCQKIRGTPSVFDSQLTEMPILLF